VQKFWSVSVRCPITDTGLEYALLYLIAFVLRRFRLGALYCTLIKADALRLLAGVLTNRPSRISNRNNIRRKHRAYCRPGLFYLF